MVTTSTTPGSTPPRKTIIDVSKRVPHAADLTIVGDPATGVSGAATVVDVVTAGLPAGKAPGKALVIKADGSGMEWGSISAPTGLTPGSGTVLESGDASHTVLTWDTVANKWSPSRAVIESKNISAGSAGSIPYQTAAGVTAQLSVGTVGQFLTVHDDGAGSLRPSWKSASSGIVSLASLTDVSNTGATDGQVLKFVAADNKWHPYSFVPSASSMHGGTAGSILFQSAKDVTSFLTIGTAGQALVVHDNAGVLSPAWENKPTIPSLLTDLSDVFIHGIADGQLLRYEVATHKWGGWSPNFLSLANGYTKAQVDGKISDLVSGVTHYESVLTRSNIPPSSPVARDAHLVGTAPTGAWVGKENNVAEWNGTAWTFTPPRPSESHLVEDTSETWLWNGTIWVKIAASQTASGSGRSDLFMVGSIQQSFLTESHFKALLDSSSQDKWVIADGRDVTGSRYHATTGSTNVPDLRGAFIRSAGQNSNSRTNWNGGPVGAFHEDTTRIPRNTALTGVTNGTGDHHHASGVPGFDDARSYVYGKVAIGGGQQTSNYSGGAAITPTTSDSGAHAHTVEINGGGDEQTAPVHFALNTFIKIN